MKMNTMEVVLNNTEANMNYYKKQYESQAKEIIKLQLALANKPLHIQDKARSDHPTKANPPVSHSTSQPCIWLYLTDAYKMMYIA
jgi:hypothetical protein